MSDLELEAIKAKWLNLCGACDAGIGECNHPSEDYRPVMLELVQELERLHQMAETLRPVLRASRRWRDYYATDITEANEGRFHPAEAAWIKAVDALDGVGFVWVNERLAEIIRPDGA